MAVATSSLLRNRYLPQIEIKHGSGQHASHPHIHSRWSFSLVIEGTTETSFYKDMFKMITGNYLIIPAFTPHICKPILNTGFSFCVIYVPFEFFRTVNTDLNQVSCGSCSVEKVLFIANSLLNAHTPESLQQTLKEFNDIIDTNKANILKHDHLLLNYDNYPQVNRSVSQNATGSKHTTEIKSYSVLEQKVFPR